LEFVEVAECEKTMAHHARDSGTAADTHEQLSKVRMPDRHIFSKISQPATMGAVRISGERIRGPSRR
jgi:hypothetical protein